VERFIEKIRGSKTLQSLLTWMPIPIFFLLPDELTPLTIPLVLILLLIVIYVSNYLFINPIKRGILLSLICLAVVVVFYVIVSVFFDLDYYIVLILSFLVAFITSILIRG
jgi:hypothetical protein